MISRDEWLTALSEVETPVDESALSIQELRVLFGFGKSKTKETINKLVEMGRATKTRKIAIDSMGRRQSVPAYRLKESK